MPANNNSQEAVNAMNAMLKSMQEMSDDITALLNKMDMWMSTGLMSALDKAARTGIRRSSSPEHMQKDLEKVTVEAKKAGHTEILEWAEGRSNQFASQIVQAKNAGVLTGEPLDQQLEARSGEVQYTSFDDLIKGHGDPKEAAPEQRARRHAGQKPELEPEEYKKERAMEGPSLTNSPWS